MKLRVTVNGAAYEVEVDLLDDPQGVLRGRSAAPARPASAPRPAAAKPVAAAPVAAPAAAPVSGGADGPTLPSPLPGTILEVHAAVGQAVKLGDPVIIIDAMKMHTEVTATQDGTVKAILVKPGDVVQMGQALIVFA